MCTRARACVSVSVHSERNTACVHSAVCEGPAGACACVVNETRLRFCVSVSYCPCKTMQGARGLVEHARVMCMRGEVTLRRGGVRQLLWGLESVISLKDIQLLSENPVSLSSVPSTSGKISLCAPAKWAAFDGGWGGLGCMIGGAGAEGVCGREGEEGVWNAVRRLLLLLLKDLALSNSAQRNTQQVMPSSCNQLCFVCLSVRPWTCAHVCVCMCACV